MNKKEENTMKIRHTIENNITWEQLKAAAEAGTAESLAPVGSELDMTLEGGEAVTVVDAWLPGS